MKAIVCDRLRSRNSGNSARQKSSASATLPTSSATWLIPITATWRINANRASPFPPRTLVRDTGL
jgi:hypothetical protein